MKNREFDQKFDREGPQNFCSERATIVDRQGASENKNYEPNPTLSKTDSSSCSSIKTKISEGVLLVDKPRGKTSFSLVTALRRLTRIEKIGHAGTLDPFATGLMVMLIGKNFTRLSQDYLCQDKEYECKMLLGISTDSYDCDGQTIATSPLIPTLADIEKALLPFQGTILQTPPMYSAKKVDGKKLYELARKGIEIERKPVSVTIKTTLLDYTYPYLTLNVACSKGTYVRSIAHDLGNLLGCGAHLSELRRIRSGNFHIKDSINGIHLYDHR